MRANTAPKILIILHQENSTPGRIGQALMARGFCLDLRRPRFGDALPASMEDHAGAVIFGGPMSANDTDAFVRREIDWIGVALGAAKPFLGVCLGAQMLVRHLGGRVFRHPQGCVEIGYYPIYPTESGERMMAWPKKVYQWHREGFDLPRGAELLAKGEHFRNQAFRYGPAAYAIQFHPELTLAMLHRWTVHGAPRMQLPCAQDRRSHFEGRALYDAGMRTWLECFLDLWIDAPRPLPEADAEKRHARPARSHSRIFQDELHFAMRRW